MAVTVYLKDSGHREIADADGADTDGFCIRFTAPDRREWGERRTVLTLRVADVDYVEIEKDGTIIRIVPDRP